MVIILRNRQFEESYNIRQNRVAKNLDPLIRTGINYSNEGLYTEALNCFNEFIELFPGDDDGYYNRAIVKWYLDDIEGAIEDNLKAIELNNNNTDAYWNLAIQYFDSRKYVQTLENFILLYQKTHIKDYLLHITKTKLILEDYSGALIDINLYINNKPDSESISDAYYYKFISLYELRRINEALECISNSIEFDKENNLIYFLERGLLYLGFKEYKKAKKDFVYAKENSDDNDFINDLNNLIKKCLC